MEQEPTPVQQPLPGIPLCTRSYTALGKQVLFDGLHFADAVDADAASCITRAMNAEIAAVEHTRLLAMLR